MRLFKMRWKVIFFSALWYFIGLGLISWFLEGGRIPNRLAWILVLVFTAFAISVLEELLYNFYKKRRKHGEA